MHLIPMQAYVDSNHHERDMAAVRQGAWHYAGLRRDLAANRDWVLAQLAGREVVVQNFEGHLSAFTNVCPHRFNAIRTGECGNGPLVCPYHRWSFDRDGAPSGVALRDTYRDLHDENLRLDRWDVDACGEFVFVRPRAENGTALRDWLGPLAPRLESIGNSLGKECGRFRIDVQANWKIVLQNTLEFDHVYSVHPETFGSIMGERPHLAGIDMPSPHVGYRSTLEPPAPPVRPIHRRVAALFERSTIGHPREHEHLLLFPLTTIGIYRRESIAILRYIPTGPAQTIVDTRLLLPRIDGLTDSEASFLMSYAETVMLPFARKLGEEDRTISESVQRGLANLTGHRGVFGAGEHVVHAFQQGYCDYIEKNQKAA